MSTATVTDPVSTEQALTLPPELWRAYRDERRMGSKQREATSHALERSAFQKSDTREKLRKLLIAREAERGLVLSAAEREEETLLEAGVEDAAVAQEVKRQLPELQEAWQRLQPLVAVGDPDAIEASKELVSEMRTAKQEKERLDREAKAAEEAEQASVLEAEKAAHKMEPVVAKLRAAVDAKAAEMVAAVVALRDAQRQHESYVAAATAGDQMAMRSVSFRPGEVESSIRYHSRGVLFSRVSGQDAPLVPQQEVK